MVIRCDCVSKVQDELYGAGKRVHNKTAKSTYRCTVCKKERAG